ncbi:hypothetical protein SKB0092_07090 [Roseomonas mucosa]
MGDGLGAALALQAELVGIDAAGCVDGQDQQQVDHPSLGPRGRRGGKGCGEKKGVAAAPARAGGTGAGGTGARG